MKFGHNGGLKFLKFGHNGGLKFIEMRIDPVLLRNVHPEKVEAQESSWLELQALPEPGYDDKP